MFNRSPFNIEPPPSVPDDCDIKVSYNCLSEEYHYRCLGDAGHHLGYWCK